MITFGLGNPQLIVTRGLGSFTLDLSRTISYQFQSSIEFNLFDSASDIHTFSADTLNVVDSNICFPSIDTYIEEAQSTDIRRYFIDGTMGTTVDGTISNVSIGGSLGIHTDSDVTTQTFKSEIVHYELIYNI